jgi:hypothetical protein
VNVPLEFRVLGPLKVRAGERRLNLGGLKQRAVLAVLLLDANRVVSFERLVDDVWASRRAGSGRSAFAQSAACSRACSIRRTTATSSTRSVMTGIRWARSSSWASQPSRAAAYAFEPLPKTSTGKVQKHVLRARVDDPTTRDAV